MLKRLKEMGKIKLTCFAILAVLVAIHSLVEAEPIEDKQALLDFINNINHSRSMNWDVSTSACSNWTGVTCNHDNSRIIALRLPSTGLKGTIPINTLGRLSSLQILSLRSNNISGVFPIDLYRLGDLTGLYLQFNRFQGPLPYNFSVWPNLAVLNLSYNGFNGIIPSSILNLTRLTVLDLANNSLSGDIPDLSSISSLQQIDLSNNNLSGVLPKSLTRFPNLSFAGNNLTFPQSEPLSPVQAPIPSPHKHSSKFSESAILGIVIGSCAAAFVSIAFLLIAMNRKNKKKTDESSTNIASQKRGKSSTKMGSEHQDGNGKLVFFEGRNLIFDLEDLLRASAEVLGKGTFGTTYRAALEDATTLAVKRLREVVVGKRDFEQQMELVGSIRHENVAPLRAYYYSKDEKLMVYDYYNLGSVSTLLHAKRGENRTPLDWEMRLNIALGAAKGISHIHSQSNGKLVHGNIKSSNIFLNFQNITCISDLGLATLMSPATSRPTTRISGYRAPEVTDTKKATQASDIYSFGVVLLELLSGKSPVQIPGGGDEIVHLVRWVQSVVREEWTGEVFDVELLRYPNIEEEMVAMLQIGLSCVSRVPDQRPRIREVVRTIEEIRGVASTNSPGNGNTSPQVTTTPSHVIEVGSSSSSSHVP